MIYSFEQYALDLGRRELRHDGDLIPVEPQVFDLIVYVIGNRERVVSKDDLIEHVWKGRIVSESTLTSRITAARQAIGDSGEDQRLIRTIARKGIRFVGEVQEDRSGAAIQAKPTSSAETVAAAIAGPQLPEKPSITVLPFVNISGDSGQEYLADGITEEIITALSKLRWFFVISRNSSFTYRGKAVDAEQIARELGVRYMLQGSVRKDGNRVRISAQLIDAHNGNHVWAERYDGELTDVFALQDEITSKVVAAIEPRLLEAEGLRSQRRSADDLGAWDMVIQANSLFWRVSKPDGEAAIAILKRAVERYPGYAPAHSMLAFMMLVSRWVGWGYVVDPEPFLKDVTALAMRATELDDSDPWAHLTLGYIAYTLRRTDEALDEFRRALDLNPNFAAAHGYMGQALVHGGRPDQAIPHLERAIRLSPHDPQNAIFNVAIGASHYLAGRYDEAIACSRKAWQQRHGLTAAHRVYCASLAQAGRIDEARAALAHLQDLHPDVSIAWIERHVPYTPAPMAVFLDGMRKAGLQ